MRARLGLAAGVATLLALMLAQAPVVDVAAAACANSRLGSSAAGSPACASGDPSTYHALQQRYGADVASGLATQQRLDQALTSATATETALGAQVSAQEAKVAALQAEIDAMDSQIAELTVQIETERTEVAALARAVYRRPNNLLDIIASSGSLSDMLTQTEDMVVAAQRAHELQDSLEGNKQRLQADRDTRQSALDQQTASLQQVQAGLSQLTGVQTELDSLAGQLTTLIALIRADASKVNNMPADVAAQLATLLEQEEHNLANQEQAAAWAQASIGAGQAADQNLLPGGTEPTGGISLNWPMNGAVITQPFGPTNFVLEPPLGQYAHFHTGIDIATPIGTPVFAAATGLVVVVAHTSVGYGNYVIIAHGFGVMTLYAHLLETDAYIGEPVIAGQQIGREGTSGFSTGPHVHFEVRIDGKVVDPMKFLPPQN